MKPKIQSSKGKEVDMKIKLQKDFELFMTYLQGSLGWIIPVSIIIVTFILLFFGISERVGDLKSQSLALFLRASDLQRQIDDLSKPKANVEVKDIGTKLTYSKENDLVKNIKAKDEKLTITNKDYWGIYFDNTGNLLKKPELYITDSKNSGAVCLALYPLEQTGSKSDNAISTIDLYEYEKDKKSIMRNNSTCGYFIGLADGKLFIYNDFASNDIKKISTVLPIIQSSKSLPVEVKNTVIDELKNLK